jgi:hypothetical protein
MNFQKLSISNSCPLSIQIGEPRRVMANNNFSKNCLVGAGTGRSGKKLRKNYK